MKPLDYPQYILTGLSLIATGVGIFAPQYQTLVLVGGVLGIGVSYVWLKVNESFEKIEYNTNQIKELKKELDYYKNYSEVKKEVEVLRTMLLGKKASATLADVLIIVMILILIYLILLALGVIRPFALA